MRRSILFILMVCLASIVFAGNAVILKDHISPGEILLDDNHLYIVESPAISIYSLKDFKLLKTFGKKGEGPQEFKGGITVDVQGDHILVNSLKRVSFFSKDGKYINEFNVVGGEQFRPLGKKGYVGHLLMGARGA